MDGLREDNTRRTPRRVEEQIKSQAPQHKPISRRWRIRNQSTQKQPQEITQAQQAYLVEALARSVSVVSRRPTRELSSFLILAIPIAVSP
jgi:hypothetical protein